MCVLDCIINVASPCKENKLNITPACFVIVYLDLIVAPHSLGYLVYANCRKRSETVLCLYQRVKSDP